MTENRQEDALNSPIGPTWQDELLGCLRRDPRFADRLRGNWTWATLPPGAPDETVAPRVTSGLGYFTSASTGAPKRIVFAPQDWRESVDHRRECLAALGVGPGQRAAVVLPFGPWFSGDHLTEALVSLGVSVLPAGIYGPHLPGVARLMAATGVGVLVTTPSVALALTGSIPAQTLDALVLVGEAAAPVLRQRLSAHFGVAPRCLFAASEAVLGPEVAESIGVFSWDPERLHLEVVTAEGRIAETGEGELLVTRRYGEASPLLRYPLGDRVELLPDLCAGTEPRFRYLGRSGHAFGLATGVKVGRAQLDRFLDGLGHPVHAARFRVEHRTHGDHLLIELGGSPPLPSVDLVRDRLLASSLDLADAHECGFLELEVRTYPATLRAKRRLHVEERPWRL